MRNHISHRHRRYRFFAALLIGLAALYAVLLIPETEYIPPGGLAASPFAWNQDDIWAALERRFQDARKTGCDSLAGRITSEMADIGNMLDSIENRSLSPEAAVLDSLESGLFVLAAHVAACTDWAGDFVELYTRLRIVVKNQSCRWDMNRPEARRRIYRLLYGGRAAAEEIMLQDPGNTHAALVRGVDEPSETPEAAILGVTVHSGDILVSRGGAPTSALIARGNDFPGNFSHVALVHVNERTGAISVIESHIESGVGISSLDDYLRDTKLRIMVLRLRRDLPALVADPLLPHKAASIALAEAAAYHIPYDFELDADDQSKLFCSEVASASYARLGIKLWMGISRISSRGLRSWLGGLGVRYFETQEPSDLEYDPQLRIIAEWRDPETLRKDRIDNAAIDVMLESADSGVTLDYAIYMLPVARITKFYSMLLNSVGSVGPIPEGMSAATALRVTRFSERHEEISARLYRRAADFEREQGYKPPYWALVNLAREILKENSNSMD